jgi:hypothetical protein
VILRKKALTKNERQIQIVTWFAIRIQHDNDNLASMSEIAGGLGVSPSSKLRKIIDGIVPAKLEKVQIKRSGRWDGWGYRLARGTFELPKKKQRELVFNHKGIRQVEMF